MTGEVQEPDKDSGLVERIWKRIPGQRRGEPTERPMIGKEINATYLDPYGGLHQAAETVRRNAAGELVVESWADGIRQETAVPRDASVTDKGTSR
jgi:hypothetical protein